MSDAGHASPINRSLSRGGGDDGESDDRCVERRAVQVSEEQGVTELVHDAVLVGDPVAVAGGGCAHADDRGRAERHRGAVELRTAEAEDAAVTGDEPVADV